MLKPIMSWEERQQRRERSIKMWQDPHYRNDYLSEEHKDQIVTMALSGMSYSKIALEFLVHRERIGQIVNGRGYYKYEPGFNIRKDPKCRNRKKSRAGGSVHTVVGEGLKYLSSAGK